MENELQHHGIKGMKWGVRRYQNKDGSLTPQGQKRYDRDQRENAGKKKGNKVGAADPNRWVREDLDRTKKAVSSSKDLTRELSNLNKATMKEVSSKPRQDLSHMSDKEMRDKINRELLERQYDQVFNPPREKKGRQYVDKTLEVAGGVLGVASTSLAIALAIKELRG